MDHLDAWFREGIAMPAFFAGVCKSLRISPLIANAFFPSGLGGVRPGIFNEYT
jgi:hypothetical protein